MEPEEQNHVKNALFWLLIGVMLGSGMTVFLFSNEIFVLQ